MNVSVWREKNHLQRNDRTVYQLNMRSSRTQLLGASVSHISINGGNMILLLCLAPRAVPVVGGQCLERNVSDDVCVTHTCRTCSTGKSDATEF